MITITKFYNLNYLAATGADEIIRDRPDVACGQAYTTYADRDALDGAGTWKKLLRHSATAGRKNSPFAHMEQGSKVSLRDAEALALGRHPKTGLQLVTGTSQGRVAGLDIQISMPKTASILAALGTPEISSAIKEAKRQADKSILQFIMDRGLLVTRKGKAGHIKTPVDEVVVASFEHGTSRENDPHIHSHNAIFNVARMANGSYVPFDSLLLKRYAGALSALHRAEFAKVLHDKLPVSFVRTGRNLEIAGVSEIVKKQFSKRREQIKTEAVSRGIKTSDHRQIAQLIANDTRKSKAESSNLENLGKRWHLELGELGFTSVQLQAFALTGLSNQSQEVIDIPDTISDSELISHALRSAFENNALLDEAQFLCKFAEECQIHRGMDWILSSFEQVKTGSDVVKLGEDNSIKYCHVDVIRLEHNMLRQAQAGKSAWTQKSSLDIEAGLVSRPTLSAEQIAAVQHCLSSDRISIAEGSAGTGKSFMLGAVAEIARSAQLDVRILAPSWTAVQVARNDTDTAAEHAKAIQAYVFDLVSGKTKITPNTLIICDEAGMVSLKDMATLVDFVSQAGAKLILAGDTRQLKPVASGEPMAAMATLLGTNRMSQIRRQQVKWQCDASMDLASGDIRRGLENYFKYCLIDVAKDRDIALKLTIDAAIAQIRDNMKLAKMGRMSETSLVITPRCVDVLELNNSIRAKLVSASLLPDQSVIISAKSRGSPQIMDLPLCAGDRIIFREKIQHKDGLIFNADFAQVLAIEHLVGQEPVLKVLLDRRLDSGDEIILSGPISGFIGFRHGQKKSGALNVPKIEHAYAATIHAAQGRTIDNVVVANLHGLEKSALYVAMTRHRKSVRMVVDEERLTAKTIRNERAIRLDGRLLQIERKTVQSSDLSDADILDHLIHEGSRVQDPSNASDFIGDMPRWIKSMEPVAALQSQQRKQEPSLKDRVAAILARKTKPATISSEGVDPLALSPWENMIIWCRTLDVIIRDLFRTPVKTIQSIGTWQWFETAPVQKKIQIGVEYRKSKWFWTTHEQPDGLSEPDIKSGVGLHTLVSSVLNMSIIDAYDRIRGVFDLQGRNLFAAAATEIIRSRHIKVDIPIAKLTREEENAIALNVSVSQIRVPVATVDILAKPPVVTQLLSHLTSPDIIPKNAQPSCLDKSFVPIRQTISTDKIAPKAIRLKDYNQLESIQGAMPPTTATIDSIVRPEFATPSLMTNKVPGSMPPVGRTAASSNQSDLQAAPDRQSPIPDIHNIPRPIISRPAPPDLIRTTLPATAPVSADTAINLTSAASQFDLAVDDRLVVQRKAIAIHLPMVAKPLLPEEDWARSIVPIHDTVASLVEKIVNAKVSDVVVENKNPQHSQRITRPKRRPFGTIMGPRIFSPPLNNPRMVRPKGKGGIGD